MSGIDSKTISCFHFDENFSYDEINGNIWGNCKYANINNNQKKFGNNCIDSSIIVKNQKFKALASNNNLTIEWWEFRTALLKYDSVFAWGHQGINIGYYNPSYSTTNLDFCMGNSGSSWNILPDTFCVPAKLNKWVHYAFVRTDTAISLYSDGTLVKSVNIDKSISIPGVGDTEIDTMYFNSVKESQTYIDEFRVSNIARYTVNFTPPIAQFEVDANTISLCHFDKPYQTKDEISTNICIPIGLPQTNLSEHNFNNVLYLDGNSYLTLPTNSNFNFGTNDFTIDCWVKCGNQNTFGTILSSGYTIWANGSNSIALCTSNAGHENQCVFNISEWWAQNGSNKAMLSSTTLINTNVWTHIAVVRKGINFLLFINGQLESQNTFNGSVDLSKYGKITIGTNLQSTNPTMIGCLDELRISNVARWTSNFTPPTLQYSKIRFLAKDNNGHFYSYKNAVWNDLGMATKSEDIKNLFINNETIDPFTKNITDTLPNFNKQCCYQENINEPILTAKITADPNMQFIQEKTDMDLKGISYLDWIHINDGISNYELGSGKIRSIVSRDFGKTWQSYNATTSTWDIILDSSKAEDCSIDANNIVTPTAAGLLKIKSNGMDIVTFNAAPWNDFTIAAGYKTIKVAYVIEINSSTDTALIDSLKYQYDGIGDWELAAVRTDYKVQTRNNSHTITWLTNLDGKRVKVNY